MMKDVDTHFGGIAKGVGEAKIVGRVHLAQLRVRKKRLRCTKMTVKSESWPQEKLVVYMFKEDEACGRLVETFNW